MGDLKGHLISMRKILAVILSMTLMSEYNLTLKNSLYNWKKPWDVMIEGQFGTNGIILLFSFMIGPMVWQLFMV